MIHPYNRLQVCAMLSSVESLGFSEVRDALGVSDSVLSKQVKVLQEAGYLAVRKETHNSRVRTWLALTPKGRKALTAHLSELRRIAEAAGLRD
ncbi:transcriptional regulator [Streptomyces sp. CC224B]|uniref:transcriptional regulator n=1 Tax=Streptomyces sp. CC224B TaxID=3044571 RepID=UPI0024A87421|nr:transcriptional regulator [Streptomyces sp. CC224B]